MVSTKTLDGDGVRVSRFLFLKSVKERRFESREVRKI